MRNNWKPFYLLLSAVMLLNACSKDDNNDGPEPEPAPTTRIFSASIETSGSGIPLLDAEYFFVYADDKNQLDGIAELQPNGSIQSVWVFLYDAAGKPESATRVASDLATVIQTISFTYAGTQLTAVNNRRIRIENNRLVNFDSSRVSYTSAGELDKIYRLRADGSEVQVGQINGVSNLRSPWSRLLPRIELQAAIPLIIPTVSVIETISRSAISTSTGTASNGSPVDIRFSYNGSENGYVTNTTRTITAPANTRVLNFTYEPIPK